MNIANQTALSPTISEIFAESGQGDEVASPRV